MTMDEYTPTNPNKDQIKEQDAQDRLREKTREQNEQDRKNPQRTPLTPQTRDPRNPRDPRDPANPRKATQDRDSEREQTMRDRKMLDAAETVQREAVDQDDPRIYERNPELRRNLDAHELIRSDLGPLPPVPPIRRVPSANNVPTKPSRKYYRNV